jgi:hypothetical protein
MIANGYYKKAFVWVLVNASGWLDQIKIKLNLSPFPFRTSPLNPLEHGTLFRPIVNFSSGPVLKRELYLVSNEPFRLRPSISAHFISFTYQLK